MFWAYIIVLVTICNPRVYYTHSNVYKHLYNVYISMNILLHLSDFTYISHPNTQCIDFNDRIRFLDPKSNNILDGQFTKILYSDENVSLNGIYLEFPMVIRPNTQHDKSSSTTLQFSMELPSNTNVMRQLMLFEKALLDLYCEDRQIQKGHQCSLKSQLVGGSVRVYKEGHTGLKYAVKISGIWETHNKVGITYKIVGL